MNHANMMQACIHTYMSGILYLCSVLAVPNVLAAMVT
jgi:hypothetical protein